ncbi:methyltransferase [Moorena producens PAL-8-15-08-1]|uniref:Methyltransferase n=1 Tax=Moorena producens PAL-8-15-08-1 TaxID=1458985 RepID=A0A1D8U3N9_9CYAN|nr:methyltransferase domain-containing protein [Moorena producens]AOX04485.1 methyltransferase [Moorena producens PAL-8-15-08-1]
MSNNLELSEFKQEVATIYDNRSNSYDKGDFHPRLANSLIEHVDIRPGQKILDIATGTGLVAIEAAKRVGEDGRVVGVDISTGLLNQAQRKISAAGLTNIELIEADAETHYFPDNSFDRVLCCSALPLMTNVPADLRLWKGFLVPGGLIGLCVFAKTAFTTGFILQNVAQKYGVSLIFSDVTGDEEKCYSLLTAAGFDDIKIKREQLGSYITISDVEGTWDGSLKHPLCWPLQQLEPKQLEQAKADYVAEINALVTDKGIWNDITTFFVTGRKNMENS